MKLSNRANLMLLLVSICWGASYPILRMSVQDLSSNAFVAARFGLAALIFFPFAVRGLRDRYALRLGMTLGAIDGMICAILAFNISQMPAARCAFLMGTSVVLVPIVSACIGRYKLTLMDLFRAALSMTGVYFITGAHLDNITHHDAWIVLAALLWATTIVILKEQTLQHNMKTAVLAFYQSVCACVVPLVLLATQSAPVGHLSLRSAGGLAYDAVFATVVTMVLQTQYQKHTTAAQAGLRLSLEPLFACLFSLILLGEPVTLGMLLGGPLMICAILLPELQSFIQTRLRQRRAARTGPVTTSV